MQWEPLGFTDDPFTTDPIIQKTLPLYVGHAEQIKVCQNVLSQRNILLVVEGRRGVGTTSFSNYLRFSSQQKKYYFTPQKEIRVESGWALDTLLAAVIANIVREIELFHPEKEILNDQRFQNAKALSMRIAEVYRSFGIEAFGFGANYAKAAGVASMPMIVPSAVLGHHLEDLAALVTSLGYRYGIVIQLNNLDIGTIHTEEHAKYLFNAIRDYIQTDGISWMLVGDVGLRKFIAQQVDRLDDIVSYEIDIHPLSKEEYHALIEKRINYYRSNAQATLPIDKEVLDYLYDITKGRLRYIFGLLQRLVNDLSLGDLTDKITMEIAKPMIIKLAKDRVSRNHLNPNEEKCLVALVSMRGEKTVSEISKQLAKSSSYTSKTMSKLLQCRLVTAQRYGKNKYYVPVLDAVIAYSK